MQRRRRLSRCRRYFNADVFLNSLQLVVVRQFDVGKASADRVGYRLQCRLHQSDPDLRVTGNGLDFVLYWIGEESKFYPSDVEEEDVHDAEDWGGKPNGEEGDEREGDTPNEGQRQGQESGQQTVNPETRSGEENVRRAPDRVESVSHIRLGQHVLKVQLSKEEKVSRE